MNISQSELTFTSVGVLAMPDAKTTDCVIKTLIVLTILTINAPRSIQDSRHFQSNSYELKYDC